MRQSQASRDAYKAWQMAQIRLQQLWRQRHGRVIILAPIVLFLLFTAWTSSPRSPAMPPASTTTHHTPHLPTTAQQDAATLRLSIPNATVHPSARPLNQSSTGKWAGAAADITKFVTNPGDGPGNATETAAALADILEFPEDLDSLDKSSLMTVVNSETFQTKKDFSGMIAPNSRMFRAPGRFRANATRAATVVAMPSDRSHLPIVEASHAWRKDMRTFVALNDSDLAASRMNDTGQEVWGFHPDDWPLKGLHAGDSRAALTPFLAHEAFKGQYSWMLYGDDDTMFFVENVLELLQDFDPSMPYLITDHYWWADNPDSESHYHPHEKAPRCLPCHWTPEDEERAFREDRYKPFEGYPGCPCTAEHICRHDGRGLFNEQCDMPVHPHRAYSIHGGAGAVISIGLMERLPMDFMQRCLADITSGTGGDAFLSRCIWKAGYAFTDPGYGFYHWEAKSFDPGPESSRKLVQDFSSALLSTCDAPTLDVISHVATAHVRSIVQGEKDTAQVMHTLSAVYDRWRAKLHATLSEALASSSASARPNSSTAAMLRSKATPVDRAAAMPTGLSEQTADTLTDHSTLSMITRATEMLEGNAAGGSKTAGIAGSGSMSAADIISDISSSAEEDIGSTDSTSSLAAHILRDAAASHDDTITAGTARTAGVATDAVTTGLAGEHAMSAEDVLLDLAENAAATGANQSTGLAGPAKTGSMSAAEVLQDIAASQAAVGVGDIGGHSFQHPLNLAVHARDRDSLASTTPARQDLELISEDALLIGEFGDVDSQPKKASGAAAKGITQQAAQLDPARSAQEQVLSEDDENLSVGQQQHVSREADRETANGTTAASAAAAHQQAVNRKRAAEMESDMDRLLETASSGGMSTGLELELSADNSTGPILRDLQRGRGQADHNSLMLPLL